MAWPPIISWVGRLWWFDILGALGAAGVHCLELPSFDLDHRWVLSQLLGVSLTGVFSIACSLHRVELLASRFPGSFDQRFGEKGGERVTTFAFLGRFPNCVHQGLLDRTGSHATLSSNGVAVGSPTPCVRGLHMHNTVRVLLSVLVSQRLPRSPLISGTPLRRFS